MFKIYHPLQISGAVSKKNCFLTYGKGKEKERGMWLSQKQRVRLKILRAVNCGQNKQRQIFNSGCCLKGFLEVPGKKSLSPIN